MIRPLTYIDQQDENTHGRMDEFGFGEHLLICPVIEQFAISRKVYLPKGKWFYQWTDALFEGGKEIEAEAPIDKMPIFIRAGAVIPNYPKMQYVGEFEISELTLHVYYAAEKTESFLYEYAGDNYGYKHGLFSLIKFSVSGSKKNLVLRKASEGNFMSTYKSYKIIIHGLPFDSVGYMLDGKYHKLNKRNFALGVVKMKIEKDFEELILG
jgi:alpha-glucosidase